MKSSIFILAFLIISIKSYSQSYKLEERNFDIESVIMNSSSLSQIMSKINFSFEQFGEKRKSNDGNFVTVRYKNNSLVTPLVTYTAEGDVSQITFLMPKSNSNSIGRNLIIKYGTKIIDGEEVIQKGNLTLDLRINGDVGMFVIK